MSGIVIRDAVRAEYAVLAGVFRRASWSNEGDRAFLSANPHLLELGTDVFDKGRVRVADVDGVIAGFAVTIDVEGVWELDDLFVDPEWMRRGIGSRLVGDAVAEARRRSVPSIEVTANDHALDFYGRAGFVVVGEAATLGGTSPRMRLDVIG